MNGVEDKTVAHFSKSPFLPLPMEMENRASTLYKIINYRTIIYTNTLKLSINLISTFYMYFERKKRFDQNSDA